MMYDWMVGNIPVGFVKSTPPTRRLRGDRGRKYGVNGAGVEDVRAAGALSSQVSHSDEQALGFHILHHDWEGIAS